MQIDQEVLTAKVAETVANELIDKGEITNEIDKIVQAKIDAIFTERADKAIADAVDAAITDGFEREYQRLDNWGRAKGPATSIRKELDRLISNYWSQRVDNRTGKPTDSNYDSVSRAEYLMTEICAKDFSDTMRKAALSVTGNLKDGFRKQIATQMDKMLDDLFRVKSLQDQGKAEKPW